MGGIPPTQNVPSFQNQAQFMPNKYHIGSQSGVGLITQPFVSSHVPPLDPYAYMHMGANPPSPFAPLHQAASGLSANFPGGPYGQPAMDPNPLPQS